MAAETKIRGTLSAVVLRACPACGAPNPDGEPNCPACEEPAPPAENLGVISRTEE